MTRAKGNRDLKGQEAKGQTWKANTQRNEIGGKETQGNTKAGRATRA